jgi:uncharacterized repeat protein (TIGR01451 family)
MKTKTFFRQCVLIFFFALLHFTPLHAQWNKMNMPDGGRTYFVKYHDGFYWAGTSNGVFKSANAEQWEHVDDLGYYPCQSAVTDGDTLYMLRLEIIAEPGIFGTNEVNLYLELIKTTNGGTNWDIDLVSEVNSPTFNTATFNLVKCNNSMYITYENYYDYYSTDNGESFITTLEGTKHILDGVNDKVLVINDNELLLYNNNTTLINSFSIPTNVSGSKVFALTNNAIIMGYAYDINNPSSGYDSLAISTDNGYNWTKIATGFPFYAIERLDDNQIMYRSTTGFGISNDNGFTWTHYPVSFNNDYIACLLQNNTDWIIGLSQSGIAKSNNEGIDWQISNTNFEGIQVYKAHSVEEKIYLSTDHYPSYQTADNGATWTEINAPTSFYNSTYKGSDTLFLEGDSYTFYSFDAGETWDTMAVATGYFLNYYQQQIVCTNDYTYVLTQDSLYVSDVSLSIPLTAIYMQGLDTPYSFEKLLIVNEKMMLVDNNANVYLSTDMGQNWTLVDSTTSSGSHMSNKLYYYNNILFLVGRDLFKVSLDGITWTPIPTFGLPTDEWGYMLESINEMFGFNGLLFASFSTHGIYMSTDDGSTWHPFSTGFPYYIVQDFSTNNQSLYAAIKRGGVWQRSIDYKRVDGIVFNDANNNQIQDTNENMVSNAIALTSISQIAAITDSVGYFNIWFDLPQDTLKIIPPIVYATVTPTYKLITQDSLNNIFAIHYIPDVRDLKITLTPYMVFIPGFSNSLNATIKNVGTATVDGTCRMVLPQGIEYVNATLSPTQISGDTLIWNIPALTMLEQFEINVEVLVSETLNIDDQLLFSSSIEPIIGDADTSNNISQIVTTVVSSFDPNDKQVEPTGNITPEALAEGQNLTYTIRFQNTGNYYAQTIRIIDTLSSHYDLSTLEILAASHSFTWSIKYGNVLEVVFDSIMLVPENWDFLASQGFIKFVVKPKSNLYLGANINNRAFIYFDYNLPIVTNTVFSPIAYPTAIAPHTLSASILKAIPNPTNGICYVQCPAAKGVLRLYNTLGALLEEKQVTDSYTKLNLQSLVNGIYVLIWTSAEQQLSTKIIKH